MRGYRIARGLTREAVAHTVGTTSAVIKNYEAGLTTPNPAAADRLAIALGVERDRLAAVYADGLVDLADALIGDDQALDNDDVKLAAHLLRRLGHVPAFRRTIRTGSAA